MEDNTQDAALIRALPYPAVLLSGREVVLANQAAEKLLRLSKLDDVFPTDWQPGSEADGMVTLCGRLHAFHLCPVGDLTLLTLLPQQTQRTLHTEERWSLISEQLRLRLSELSSAAELLTGAAADLNNETVDRAMEILQQGIYRTLRMVRHLEMAEDGALIYRPQSFDLSGFCRFFCGQAGPLVKQAERRLTWSTDPVSLITSGDMHLLYFVLLTLLSNAIKATPKGGEIAISVTRSGDRAVVRVADQGQGGFPFAQLFDASAVPGPGGGLGLGIALTRAIVELHGGSLMADAGSDGFAVILNLPIQENGAEQVLSQPAVDREGGFSPLLVELSDALPSTSFTYDDVE